MLKEILTGPNFPDVGVIDCHHSEYSGLSRGVKYSILMFDFNKFTFQVLEFTSTNWSKYLILKFDVHKDSFLGARVCKYELEQIFDFDQQVSFLGVQVRKCKL